MAAKETPLMKQYWEIKSAHPDKIVFFRMGDFFELFHDDAVTAAPILDITLTSRNKKAEDETPMCGVPHFSVGGHINRLLSRGFKVAICDQIEDPKLAKGIVKRAVTRILSPGMVYDPDSLDGQTPNYLASYDNETVSFLEPTTGECFYFCTTDSSSRESLLKVLRPVELVLTQEQRDLISEIPPKTPHLTVFEPALQVSEIPNSAARLKTYAETMQGSEIAQSLSPFVERPLALRLQLSQTTLRHLEIFETYSGEKDGSFFNSIDRTKTSAGARLLRQWLMLPLCDAREITRRQSEIQNWVSHPRELQEVRTVFAKMGDLERRLGKLSNPNCNPRDLMALAQSLQAGIEAGVLLKPQALGKQLERVGELSVKILTTLVDEPPLSKKDGHMIRQGVHPELDELISLTTDSQSKLQELETKEREATGIPSLKIRYNNVFGYYIEVTNTHKAKVPDNYLRKQTLVNAERFITEELQELERKVLSARTRREEIEFEIFEALRREALARTNIIMELSRYWAESDVLSGLAWLAVERKYVRPELSANGDLALESSRHPVIEQLLKSGFVPNTIALRKGETLLLTGPNMAGKSTLMRQVALTALLTQIGSFVSAKKAVMPIFDRLFTRIGAADALTEGLSTFMVEMVETAEILKNCTPNSLIVLDEIGRGTSTYDGMSLAQAILEALAKSKAITLFATHYHELTDLELEFPQIKNGHMSIREKSGDIQFLHTLSKGPANRSYGIEVARRAGLPQDLINRASSILKGKEEKHKKDIEQLSLFSSTVQSPVASMDSYEAKALERIRDVQIDNLTPLEALLKLSELKESLRVTKN